MGEYLESGSIAFSMLGMLFNMLVHVFLWIGVFSLIWVPIWLGMRRLKNKNK